MEINVLMFFYLPCWLRRALYLKWYNAKHITSDTGTMRWTSVYWSYIFRAEDTAYHAGVAYNAGAALGNTVN